MIQCYLAIHHEAKCDLFTGQPCAQKHWLTRTQLIPCAAGTDTIVKASTGPWVQRYSYEDTGRL